MQQQHHAYLLYADSIANAPIPEAYKQQSVDVQHFIFDRMSIDDARALSLVSQSGAFDSPERVFVIQTANIAIEAQNALLKLFEEPPSNVAFYIIGKRTLFLLPTLRSRLFMQSSFEDQTISSDVFLDFLNAPLAERLTLIAERTKAKDQDWIDTILNGCELFASAKPEEQVNLIAAVVQVRSYINTRGASAKMLLEELALTLDAK